MSHLDEGTWERLALDELDAEARSKALAHVWACPSCQAIARGLALLAQGARDIEAAPPRRRTWLVASGAAAMAAALLLFVWLGREPGDATRGAARDAVIIDSPRGPVPSPVRVSWRPVAGADAYRVRIYRDDGHPVWSAEAAAPPLDWPGAAPGPYRVQVEALAAGAAIAGSRLERFEIAP
jgi:hypothetical protein